MSEGKVADLRMEKEMKCIYIGRLFKNDTERSEKLFDLYTKMTRHGGETAA